MEFEAYLISKKIDPEKFRSGNPELFQEFSEHFAQQHPNSFTVQKLFLINKIRRTYQWVEKTETPEPEVMEQKPTSVGPPKPKMIPKIKR